MNKKKKNTKKPIVLIVILTISLLILISIIFMAIPSWNSSDTENSGIETEYSTEQNTESTTESGLPENENPEISSEIVITKPLSYLELCELDYVEPPVKRTREEAIEKLKELSQWFPALYYVYENEASYPDELLRSGANNPEMADFLYGYLTHESAATGGFTEEEQAENYPLFLQWDIRWGYVPYGSANLGATGCGPTCLSMAVFYLTGNRECTPDAVAQYSLNHGHYVQNVGTSWALLSEYPKEHGLTSIQIRLSEDNLKAELDKGNILICSVREGNFTSEGHFIVIYGYDENGFKVNDPKCIYRSRLSWTYEQINGDIKATWSIGK